jgi:hypothetical protein
MKNNMNNKKRNKILKTLLICLLILGIMSSNIIVFAAEEDPLQVVNNLSDFIFGLIRAIGMIILGFSVVQIGLSIKSHDASQRANGFLTFAGGLFITFAKDILDFITK